jgi:hypothetical protein
VGSKELGLAPINQNLNNNSNFFYFLNFENFKNFGFFRLKEKHQISIILESVLESSHFFNNGKQINFSMEVPNRPNYKKETFINVEGRQQQTGEIFSKNDDDS